jgi:hypothetical protein
LRRKHEFFRITRYARTYDRRIGKFTINIACQTATETTPRTIGVAEGFGLGIDPIDRFNIQLLGSSQCILAKLQSIDKTELAKVKEAL